MSEWINTKDRLPEVGKDVLAVVNYKDLLPHIEILAFYNDHWCNESGYGLNIVTHWMPLPEPPEVTEHAG